LADLPNNPTKTIVVMKVVGKSPIFIPSAITEVDDWIAKATSAISGPTTADKLDFEEDLRDEKFVVRR